MQLTQTRDLDTPKREELERRLINSIIMFWNEKIVKPLSMMDDPLGLGWTVHGAIDTITIELHERMEKHIKAILRLGLLDVSYRSRTSTAEVNAMYVRYVRTTSLATAISRLAEALSTKLLTVPDIRVALDTNVIAFTQLLQMIAEKELQPFLTVIRSDTQYAIHLGRELEWKAQDPKGNDRYRWGVGRDKRTTVCCQEIASLSAKGVPLDRLKRIIYEKGTEHFPTYRQRPWNPHWNCRSGAERVIIL